MKKLRIFCISIIISITVFLSSYFLIVYFFYKISEADAIRIWNGVVAKKYSWYCGWGFWKDVTLKLNEWGPKYLFESLNDTCSIIVWIDEYGWYDTAISPRN